MPKLPPGFFYKSKILCIGFIKKESNLEECIDTCGKKNVKKFKPKIVFKTIR